jgi:hypothetical protein
MSTKKRKTCVSDELPFKRELWVNQILPFVGMGHFVFVAGVNHQMKEYYQAYCANVDNPPYLKKQDDDNDTDDEDDEVDEYGEAIRPATASDTFYSVVFSSVACAKFWDSQTNKPADNNYNVCRLIAKTGNLQVLKWARQKKFLWDEDACHAAAKRGHSEMLKYLHENGCPWDGKTCVAAARYGQVVCLNYALVNGCPFYTPPWE